MEDDDYIALVALIISLLALLASSGQLSQALFGTAEGHMRCQSPVVGPWARFTRREWCPRSFRYETKFTTPYIKLMNIDTDKPDSIVRNPSGDGFILRAPVQSHPEPSWIRYLLGSRKERTYPVALEHNLHWQSLVMSHDGSDDDDLYRSSGKTQPDLVTWYYFLHNVAAYEFRAFERISLRGPGWNFDSDSRSLGPSETSTGFNGELHDNSRIHLKRSRSRVVIELIERSWSLLPAETVKPFAQSTLGDILVIANRLGMTWTEFSPLTGTLHAEGCGHSLYSAGTSRGLGILLEYRYEPQLREKNALRMKIPSSTVDSFGCGMVTVSSSILPPSPTRNICLDLKDPEYPLSPLSPDSLKAILHSLGFPRESIPKPFVFGMDHKQSCCNVVLDAAICLFTSFLPFADCHINCVPWPCQSGALFHCLFLNGEGRAIFTRRLGELVANEITQMQSSILSVILGKLENFKKRFSRSFPKGTSSIMHGDSSIERRERINYFAAEMEWIAGIMRLRSDIPGQSLMITASRCLVQLHDAHRKTDKLDFRDYKANDWIKQESYYDGCYFDPFALELAHQFVDEAHTECVSRSYGSSYIATLEEWWMLVYRGICWGGPIEVDMRACPQVSPRYFGSTMPVYIT